MSILDNFLLATVKKSSIFENNTSTLSSKQVNLFSSRLMLSAVLAGFVAALAGLTGIAVVVAAAATGELDALRPSRPLFPMTLLVLVLPPSSLLLLLLLLANLCRLRFCIC